MEPGLQLGELNLTPRDLCLAMVVALGAAVIIRDLFKAISFLEMAHEARTSDPNKLAAEALEHLGMVDQEREREEDEDGRDGT